MERMAAIVVVLIPRSCVEFRQFTAVHWWGIDMCLAIPAQVVEIVPGFEHYAVVDVAGVRRRIDTGLLENGAPVPGDWVLVHVGFAMSKISAEYAAEQMELLSKLGESEAARQETEGYGAGDSGP